jgi:DNA-binding NtrC family response regulator
VVEDDELLRLALASFLRTAAASVLVAGDTEGAVAAIAEDGVDVVLSDVQLPGHSGIWLAEWVHEAHPALPVILMSGTHPRDRVLPASVRRFFRKPLDPEALIDALASLSGGS